jgi:phosphate-selective porin OprO and OprP
MYKTKWNLQPLVRYENYNTDVTTKNREEHTLVFGLNYWLNDWTRIQMNYLYKSEDRIEVKNDEFIIQFQVTF